MTVKLVVLYPHPVDKGEFERSYVSDHLPLMRRLVGPDIPLPTYRTLGLGAESAPYYGIAEIHFGDLERLKAFVRSEQARIGRRSSRSLSTGGEPVVLLCEQREEI